MSYDLICQPLTIRPSVGQMRPVALLRTLRPVSDGASVPPASQGPAPQRPGEHPLPFMSPAIRGSPRRA